MKIEKNKSDEVALYKICVANFMEGGTTVNIKEAKLCIECDEIFEGVSCPKCGGQSFAWVNPWLSAPEAKAEYFRMVGNLPPRYNRVNGRVGAG